MGVVVGAHALRGQLRVKPYQPPAPSIAPGRELVLAHAGQRRPIRITAVGEHGPVLLVTVDGVGDRSAAEALRGAELLVPAADLPPPGPDEVYWHEIVGFAVETVAGEQLGAIAETISTGLHDVWVVRDGGREHLIPVVDDVVRRIDRDGRRVVIDPLPGLLEP